MKKNNILPILAFVFSLVTAIYYIWLVCSKGNNFISNKEIRNIGIPLITAIFSIKTNCNAIKKNPHSYYTLRILGIINLTIINSICSFIIVDYIERQKKNLIKI